MRLHDFTVFLMYFPWLPKLRYSKNTEFSIFYCISTPQRLGQKYRFFGLRNMFFRKTRHHVFKHRTTQHGGREGEQEQVSMCSIQTTVYLSETIDRQSVSPVIVRGLCDVWIKINSATFVTDEQNVLALCPAEDPANLVALRI